VRHTTSTLPFAQDMHGTHTHMHIPVVRASLDICTKCTEGSSPCSSTCLFHSGRGSELICTLIALTLRCGFECSAAYRGGGG
jgi:hypothetical protein